MGTLLMRWQIEELKTRGGQKTQKNSQRQKACRRLLDWGQWRAPRPSWCLPRSVAGEPASFFLARLLPCDGYRRRRALRPRKRTVASAGKAVVPTRPPSRDSAFARRRYGTSEHDALWRVRNAVHPQNVSPHPHTTSYHVLTIDIPYPPTQDPGAPRQGVTVTAIAEPAVTNQEVASTPAPAPRAPPPPAKTSLEISEDAPAAPPQPKRAPVHKDLLQAVVMAGGPSTGNPLTEYECAASLKFAATNRLIDFPLANIINSGMKRAFVLTQFNSYTLNQHVQAAYPPEVFGFGSDGYVHTHHDLRQRPPPRLIWLISRTRLTRHFVNSTFFLCFSRVTEPFFDDAYRRRVTSCLVT